MRKVAIVYGRRQEKYEDDYGIVAHSITDWVEVSEKDYGLLYRYLNYGYRDYDKYEYMTLLEQPSDQKQTIDLMIADHLKLAEELEKEEEARKKKAEETKKKRLETKKQKELEKAKAIFEKYNKDNMMMNLNEFDEDDG